MTITQYNEKLKTITEEFNKAKLIILKDFALSNNPHKIDDKITDHIGSIIIEKIQVTNTFYENRPSECVYIGPELKKDGSVKKKKNSEEIIKRYVWQSNLIKDEKTI